MTNNEVTTNLTDGNEPKAFKSQATGLAFGDLIHILLEKIGRIYQIDCITLLIYDETISKINVAYISEIDKQTNKVVSHVVDDVKEFSIIAKEIAGFEFPIIKSRSEWIAEFGENHCITNNADTYLHHCYLPLEKDNQILGTLNIHNLSKELSSEGLVFCSNIADILAEGVFMMKTNSPEPDNTTVVNTNKEHFTGRCRDKDILLTLSADLSKARNKDDINFILHKSIRQVLDFEQLMVRLFNADKKTHDIYFSTIKDFKGAIGKQLIAQGAYSADDYLCSRLKQTEEPIILNTTELLKLNEAPDYLTFWHKHGIKQVIAIRLLYVEEPWGILLINLKEKDTYNEADIDLLKGIANQVSAAIANVLAHEQINRQLDEIRSFKEKLEEEKVYLQKELPDTAGNYGEIIGNGAEMKGVFNLLSQVADSETTVLILGETGTGKELIARALHNNSKRKNKVMIKVNCAAIPANLIESELFGHEKGSFTGATERRTGKFELAHNSTIFLDEIGELPMELQVKLLRVLQEKEFERVGGKATLHTDVRIISATNRNLQNEVAAGNFRSDLFYRLNVFPIKLPALRERMEDLPVLAAHFLNKYNHKAGKLITGFSNKAIHRLKSYHWPGNIRELEHLIERHVLLTKGTIVTEIKIPTATKAMLSEKNEPVALRTLFESEREYIFSVLQHCNGRVSGPDGAAKILGVPATTLNSKIKKLGLTKTHMA